MKYLLFLSLVVLATAGKNKEKRKQEKLLAKQNKLNGRSNKNKQNLNQELIPPFPNMLTGFSEPEVPMFSTEVELRIEIPGTEELKERVGGLELADAILKAADAGLEEQIYNVAVNAETVDRLLDERVSNVFGVLTETVNSDRDGNSEVHDDHKDRLDFLTEQDEKKTQGLLLAAEGLDEHEGMIAATNLEVDALARLGELAIEELRKELGGVVVAGIEAGQQAVEGINGRLSGHDDAISEMKDDAAADNEQDEKMGEVVQSHAEQLALMKQDETLDRQRIAEKFQNLGKVIGEIAAQNEGAIAALDFKVNQEAYVGEEALEEIEEKFLEVGLEIETLDLATSAMVEGMGDSLRAVDESVEAVRKEVGEAKDALENTIGNVAQDVVDLQLDVAADMDTQRDANEEVHDKMQSDFASMKRGAAAAHDSIYRRIEAEKNARTVVDSKITEVMGGIQEEVHGLTDIDYKQQDFIEREITIEGEIVTVAEDIQDEVVAMNEVNKRLTGEISQMKRTSAAVHDSLGRDMILLEDQIQEVSSSALMEKVTAVEGKCLARAAEVEAVVTVRVKRLEQELEQEQENNAVHMRKIAALEQAQIARLGTISTIQQKLANQERMIQELIRLAQKPKVEIVVEEVVVEEGGHPPPSMEEIVLIEGGPMMG